MKADKDPRSGPYGGKAVGEPPLLASCSVMNALRGAIRSARSDSGLGDEYFDMSKFKYLLTKVSQVWAASDMELESLN